MELMLHNYDSQMLSVLFWHHKRNKNIFITSSLVHGCRHYEVATFTMQNRSGPDVMLHVENKNKMTVGQPDPNT